MCGILNGIFVKFVDFGIWYGKEKYLAKFSRVNEDQQQSLDAKLGTGMIDSCEKYTNVQIFFEFQQRKNHSGKKNSQKGI